MFNIIHSGKNNDVILGSTPKANTEKNIIKKYHTYFRQRDTLKNIPKELEPFVKVKDEDSYNAEIEAAAERLSQLKESRVEKLPTYDMNYYSDYSGYIKEEKKNETQTEPPTLAKKKSRKSKTKAKV